MVKKKASGADLASATGKRFLRVHAEGAQNIHASDSKFSLDAKPDPYVVFVLNDVTHKCDHVDDVEPLKYFAWPNAVKDFEITQEKTLTDSSLVVHVKDSDTIKDRYIGGTTIPLGPLYAAMQANVLCHSKIFTLEFADEKFKKRKDSGEIKLTITLIEDKKLQDVAAAAASPPSTSTAEAAQSQPQKPDPVAVPAAPIPVLQPSPPPDRAKEAKKAGSIEAIAAPALAATVEELESSEKSLNRQPSAAAPELKPEASVTQLARQPTASKRDIGSIQRQATIPALKVGEPVATPQPDANLEPQARLLIEATPALATTTTTASVSATGIVKTMAIELVSARNLTRPVSLGAIFDRKPDPFVALEFYGMSKASAPLKDVDLKKSVEWKQAALEFDLPLAVVTSVPRKGASPMDLVIHVKDENLMKPTYMGGTKVSIEEFFQSRGASGEWIASPATAVSGVERTYELNYGDEKLSKRKQCGEITVRFRFVADTPPPVIAEPAATEIGGSKETIAETTPVAPVAAAQEPDSIEKAVRQTAPESEASSVPVDTARLSIPVKLSNDVKVLSIEALCGRNLLRPSAGANPKGLMKALFDRKPDPYVIFVLDGQQKKCPALKDADVAFFEWRQAVQVFEFSQKPYPRELVVHVRDEDTVGKDPYMAGARILLDTVWEAAATDVSSVDAELVKVCPLTFIDENLTKQKPCGEITLRFRWIYAETPLPVAEEVSVKAGAESALSATLKESPIELDNSKARQEALAKSHIGYVVLRNLVLWDKDLLIDSSLDLYVAATSFPPTPGQNAKARVAATTSVLSDATKKTSSTSDVKVEWKEEELVLPVIAFDGDSQNDFMIELKDKNAITKDTQVAELLLPIRSIIASDGDRARDVALELELGGTKKKKSKSSTDKQTVQLSFKIQFVPLGSPLLGNALSSGIVLTVFFVKGLLKFDTDAEKQKRIRETAAFVLNVDYLSNQKKRGFLSLSKHDVEAQTDRFQPHGDLSIEWRTCLDVVYSSKQIAAAKDKDSLDVEVQLLEAAGSKTPKLVGSAQLNLWALLTNTSTTSDQLTTTTIRFGENASMALEFAVAHRSARDDVPADLKAAKASGVSAFKAAVQVPNGNLHLLVVKAQGLVSPNPSEEKAEDLDPEVRISIEPKYVKRKDHPVRSMLKTRPLENAGFAPTWNEYLRLEYRLPPPPTAPTDVPVGKAMEESSAYAHSIQMLPPPIVQVGIYDIEVPGERHGSKIIGKAEVPLSAFMLSKIDPSLDTQMAISMKIDVHLLDKATGSLFVEGVFEPLDVAKGADSEKQQEMVRTLCRSIGKSLSIKAKSWRSNPDAPGLETVRQKLTPGRLEIHLVCIRYGDIVAEDKRALMAHVWLNSSLDDRKELKSKLETSSCSVKGVEEGDVVWDRQTTLYAQDVSCDLLRIEVLTITGQIVGSVKLPLSGLQSYAAGQMAHDWHPLIAPAVAAKSSIFSKAKPPPAHKAMIGVAFYPDQALFQPLEDASSVIDSAEDFVIVLRCGKLVFGGEERGASRSVNGTEEIACKFALLGDVTSGDGSATSTFQKQVAARNNFVAWNEVVSLELGTSPQKFVQRSVAIGACPVLRVEVVLKRKNGRFPELLTSYELSLAGVLSHAGSGKLSRLCALYSVDEKSNASFVGVLHIELLAIPVEAFRSKQPDSLLSDAEEVTPIPGVLCIRFIAGRNLTDVDPNGEQDPYVVAKVAPYFPPLNALANACQTGISMNGGCHPQWNSPVYHMQIRDLRTDFLRIEVIDSNEEDHLADALIGSLSVAAASLFRDEVASQSSQRGKTKWFEAWLPIYPIGSEKSDDVSGEIRVDYRFVSLDYFLHAENFEDNARATSPFKLEAQREAPATPKAGKIYFHIVRAKNLPCTKGMQPGVRVACSNTGFTKVSKPAIGSIQNPEWEDEIMEMEWPEHDASLRPSTVVSVEIVDLSVRTANASSMAVITFGYVNFDLFLGHPTAASYVYHEVGGSRDKRESACILLGCQYIPRDRENDVKPFQRKQKDNFKGTEGQLHLKVLKSRFDMPCFFDRMMMNRNQVLRFRLLNGAHGGKSEIEVHEEQFAFPETPTRALVEDDGVINWQGKGAPSEESAVRKYSLLFDCATSSEEAGSELLCVNPILICEVMLQEDDATGASEEMLGELEIPIFDFILLDGHLASSWYPLSLPTSQFGTSQTSSSISRASRLGEIKLEFQYLPSLAREKTAKPVQLTDSLMIVSVQVKEARNLPISQHQVCVVGIDMLGVSMETMPNPTSSTASSQESSSTQLQKIIWNEDLEFPFSADKLRSAKDFAVRIQIRDALQGNGVIASCNWVVPPSVVACSDTPSQPQNQDIGEEVVLKLQLEKDATQLSTKSSDKTTSEISLSIRRVAANEQLQIELRSAQTAAPVARCGLLYFRLDSPAGSAILSGSLVSSSTEVDELLRSFQEHLKQKGSATTSVPLRASDWIEVDRNGVVTSVFPVENSVLIEKRKLFLLLSQTQPSGDKARACAVGYAQIDSRSLVSALKSPKIEFFQQAAIQPLSAAQVSRFGDQLDPRGLPLGTQLPLRFKFVKVCQGEIVLNLVRLGSLPNNAAVNSFRVEIRLQHSKSTWTKSSIGVLSRKTSDVEWNDTQKPIKLLYSNELEEQEPILHIVVYRLNGAAVEGESGVREAYGQLSLLDLLADPKAEAENAFPVQVPMTTADLGASKHPLLHLKLRFIGDELSFGEKQALEAQVRKETAFELAEGTAELKRSFVFMGGDEETPLKISALKEHLLADDSTGAAKKAREVLQHAADMETGGDLDRLFAAMDVNGDGMLSWDEYADHMQNMHALAHASATKPQAAAVEETRDEEEIASGAKREERNLSGEVDDDDIRENGQPALVNSIRALSAVSKPPDAQETAVGEKVDEYTPPAPVRQAPQSAAVADSNSESSELSSRAKDAKPQRKVPDAPAPSSKQPPLAQTHKQPEKTSVAQRASPSESRDPIPSEPAAPPIAHKKQYPVLSTYVLDWKVEDVVLWLTSEMELGQYCDAIQKNAVSGKLLLTLSEAELETEIGVVAPLHKRKLMNQIREFQEQFGSQAALQTSSSPEKKKPRKPQPLETVIFGETPAFIKREELMYQEKQKATESSNPRPLKIGGGLENPKVLRATTRLVQPAQQPAATFSAPGLQGESFVDAMQDIMESVRPHSPPPEEDIPPARILQQHSPAAGDVCFQTPTAFPVIQIGSITNTDELFEIVKQRIQQLSQVLLPLSKEQQHETFSDFGDDADDGGGDQSEPEIQDEEKFGLHLVFHAFTTKSKSPKISRARFQEGLASLLSIDVSWHQFDLLFRRLDVDIDGELSFDEFCDVFQRDHLTFQREDLLFLEDALVNFAIEKLETQQWTLIELFKAFDRDGGGEISIAEFATLARFLFTRKDKRRLKSEQEKDSQKRSKRLVYLLMSCLDVSADRRISLQEFLRFFFVVWSSRLMEVQDQLFDCESRADTTAKTKDVIESLRGKKRAMRKALRTNFSRPFRDSMRCVDVNMPSPFSGLLSRLQLLPSQPTEASSTPNPSNQHQQLQIWQVLQGHTSTSHRDPMSMTALYAETKAKATDESRKRVQKGKNEVLRTRLTRHREPERANAVLQTPPARVSLDEDSKLKHDHRGKQ